MSMTVEEALEVLGYLLGHEKAVDSGEMEDVQNCLNSQEQEALKVVLSEIQQYRTIGTVSEFRENKNFLEFLYNHIPPNEMEKYLAMYHASEEKGECRHE